MFSDFRGVAYTGTHLRTLLFHTAQVTVNGAPTTPGVFSRAFTLPHGETRVDVQVTDAGSR